MAFPKLTAKNTTREFIDVFNGYNHKLKIQDGEFYETKNLTSAKYPLFATRQRRATKAWTAPPYDSTVIYHSGDYVTNLKQPDDAPSYIATYRVKSSYASLSPGPFDPTKWDEVDSMFSNPRAILAKDALVWVDGSNLYIDGKATPIINLQTTKPTHLVSMNAYVCVFPDKKYINVLDQTDWGYMESTYDLTQNNYTLQPCHEDGSVYTNIYYSKPDTPQNGGIWIDSATRTAREYSSATSSWVILETPYTRITFPDTGLLPTMFKVYDGVKVAGLPGEDEPVSKIIYAIGGNQADPEAGISAVQDWFVVAGMYARSGTYSAMMGISRTVPDMDYVCEAGNRLWGCKYGRVNGENINEIYCCALGDFTNWEQYLGISTDSWRASRGSDGEFTGCINYLGTPTFFKENMIHPVSISSTGAHQVTDIPARGVQSGSGYSLAVVNETLYYKSRTGIMAYQGGMPTDVADQLANEKYYNAIAGVFGQNYYISMQDKDDQWQFFCYDASRGIWMHEDNLHAEGFAALGDELYVLSGTDILALNGTEGNLEPPVEWMAESGILPYRYPDKKYVYRYDFSLIMEQNSNIKLYIEYDSSGIWTFMGDVVMDSTPSMTGSKTIPVRPRRCDHLRLRIEGKGDVQILSITRILEKGSDV